MGPIGAQGPQGSQGPRGETGAAGPAGTTGQTAFTVGTTLRTAVTTVNVLTDLGLSGMVNITSTSSVVTLATDGGIQINSNVSGQSAVVNIVLLLDNATFLAGRQYIVSNNTGFVGVTNWSFTTSVSSPTLTVGMHSFKVFAQYAGGTATAFAGATPGSLLQGSLTVTALNR